MNELKNIRKPPRSPGVSFLTMVQGYNASGAQPQAPDYLLIDNSEWFGDQDIPVDRYISREIHEQEKERIWKKVWQQACREEEIPDVGDAITYEICDMSVLVVRVTPTEIKAYWNVCLHQGRLLREGLTHNTELRCPFHGFCWKLDGKLMHIPSQWDFPQIDKAKFNLREVKVGRWGGFVFINMDPNCEDFASYIGDMGMHWEKFPLEDRYIAAHVYKVLRSNWKSAQEAFMEGYHIASTHTQIGVYYGGGTADTSQFDARGNYSRALGQGEMNLKASWTPEPGEQLDTVIGLGHPKVLSRQFDEFLDSKDDFFTHELKVRTEFLREIIGDKVKELTPFEIYGGGYFTLFPNFHPWWAYDEVVYRFRPYKDEPEMCVMETYLLRPFKGERPKPAAAKWVGADESFLEASAELGPLARIFDQDQSNIHQVQEGLHNLAAIGKGTTHGTYQATKIRHFHKLWEKWMYGDAAKS